MSEPTEQLEPAETVEEQAEEETGWLIPWNLSIVKLDKITKACFQARADTNPVSPEDISRASGTHVATVGQNMRFLASIGVLEERGAKKYVLSTEGASYAKSLGIADLENAGVILNGLLQKSHLSEIIGFAQVEGDSLTYDILFNQIKTLARVKVDDQGGVSDPLKAGIRCLISLLARAALVSPALIEEPRTSRGVSSGPRKPRQIKEPRTEAEKDVPKTEPTEVSLRLSERTLPLNISISIEAKDPESIKAVMELIKYLRNSLSASTE